ncbi:MAG: hypothetical protein OK456_07035 [Thaumarchaeota archaeon]|nr:hypothetical protein [Nitrososphaerota archaeon]
MRLCGRTRRSAVSPVIATLLLIAIAVASSIIVYSFVTGLIGGLTAGASGAPIVVTGDLSLPNGASSGTVVLSVRNSADRPITGVTVALASQMASYTANGISNANAGTAVPGLVMVGGAAVSGANPINVGETGGGAFGVSGVPNSLDIGTDYSLTVTASFQNGGSDIEVISVVGQI